MRDALFAIRRPFDRIDTVSLSGGNDIDVVFDAHLLFPEGESTWQISKIHGQLCTASALHRRCPLDMESSDWSRRDISTHSMTVDGRVWGKWDLQSSSSD
jgi:hypothetical protein